MITSKDNELIRLCSKIKEKKYSKEKSLALVESSKIINQLYLKGKLTHIIVCEKKANLYAKYNKVKVEIVSDSIINYLSDSVTPDGVLGIANISRNFSKFDYSKCIILDKVQDPSNIGAIIRSAYAFGYKTLLCIDSAYPYTFKCIRASMGYAFDINIVDVSYDELKSIKEENNLTIVSADMDGELLDDANIVGNYAIVIGNEGNGISKDIEKMSDKAIRIPMQNGVESLNASVSAGIIMYTIKNK